MTRSRRTLLRWIGFLALVYLGVVAVFWLLERSLVFHPSSPAESWEKPQDDRTRDVTFAAADGPMIHGWWLPPESPAAGAVLVAHGNGGNLSHRGGLAAELRRSLGAGVLLFDYPGYGKSEGQPTEAGCYSSAEAAFRWLTDGAKIPANRVVFFGESLGGGPAVELATRHDHRALVLLYTFTSLPAAAHFHYPWLPTRTMMRTRFDNLSKIARCHRPVFIAHGTADEVVPFSHGEALYAAANEPKQFLPMQGFAHGIPAGDEFYGPLAKFLAAHAP